MNAFTVFMAVMFGIYLSNLLSLLFGKVTGGWNKQVRLALNLLGGLILFFLFIGSVTASSY